MMEGLGATTLRLLHPWQPRDVSHWLCPTFTGYQALQKGSPGGWLWPLPLAGKIPMYIFHASV